MLEGQAQVLFCRSGTAQFEADFSGLLGKGHLQKFYAHSVDRDLPIIMGDVRGVTRLGSAIDATRWRFAAIAPLIFADGLRRHSIAVVDRRPRESFALADCETLEDAAKRVSTLLCQSPVRSEFLPPAARTGGRVGRESVVVSSEPNIHEIELAPKIEPSRASLHGIGPAVAVPLPRPGGTSLC